MDITTLTTLVPALAPYAGTLTSVVAVCAFAATRLPPPDANEALPVYTPARGLVGRIFGTAAFIIRSAYPPFYRAVNFVALNFGHAANATAPKAP